MSQQYLKSQKECTQCSTVKCSKLKKHTDNDGTVTHWCCVCDKLEDGLNQTEMFILHYVNIMKNNWSVKKNSPFHDSCLQPYIEGMSAAADEALYWIDVDRRTEAAENWKIDGGDEYIEDYY